MDCRPDWTVLPSDILLLIARKFTDIWDYIRFRAVCVSWRLAAGTTDLEIQVPWLVTPMFQRGGGLDEDTTEIFFLNHHAQPSCNYYFEIYETEGKWIFGSAHGWLVMVGRPWFETSSITLLNPITKEEILLPRLPTTEEHWMIKKAILCSHPASTRPGVLLVVIWFMSNRLTFYRKGDHEWTILQLDGWATRDIVYYDDVLYLVDYTTSLSVLQVESSTIRHLIHPRTPARTPEVENMSTLHLVEAAGDLLLVTRDLHNMKLAVYKLDTSGNEELNWVMIGDIAPDKTNRDNRDFLSGWKGSVWAQALPDCRGYQIYYAYADEKYFRRTAIIRELHAVPGVGIKMIEQPYYQTNDRFGHEVRMQSDVTWMVAKLY